MKPTLLVMAAGMGSRFGGLKQIEPVGPQGAALLDYSIHDALRSGFGKVVFIIRREFEKDFRQSVGSRWEKLAPVDYVFQEMDLLPPGFTVPPGRVKPWGTGHAVWAAREKVREPFAAVNADDYYGPDSWKALAGFLSAVVNPSAKDYALVGFSLSQTLSEHGPVARGVCAVGAEGLLQEVVERTQIERADDKIRYREEGGDWGILSGGETVSMNLWGLTPAFFGQLEEGLELFLKEKGREEKSEFLVPRVVDGLIRSGKARVRVLPTKDQWFGMTYPQDLPSVREKLAALQAQGIYPDKLG